MPDTDYVRARVQELRESQPDTCWRPSPDWQRVCILDLGHAAPCGWEFVNGDRMRWAQRIDGEELAPGLGDVE